MRSIEEKLQVVESQEQTFAQVLLQNPKVGILPLLLDDTLI